MAAAKKGGASAETEIPVGKEDPRAEVTDAQDRIDLNDPHRPGVEIVTEQLGRKAGKN